MRRPEVCFRSKTGPHLLKLSSSPFDPIRTWIELGSISRCLALLKAWALRFVGSVTKKYSRHRLQRLTGSISRDDETPQHNPPLLQTGQLSRSIGLNQSYCGSSNFSGHHPSLASVRPLCSGSPQPKFNAPAPKANGAIATQM